jgi:hypothetical protein
MSTTIMPMSSSDYPATLSIDYPDRNLNRLTSFFRIFTIIPIAIVIGLISNSNFRWGEHSSGGWTWMSAGGLLFLPLVLMILFRLKYPKWWFDWNLALTRFSYRVSCYLLLLRDEYPSTDEEQAVHLDLIYPDAQTQLGRGWPLIKWFLSIPHYFVLFFLFIAVFVSWIIAWFAILFTGRYPKGLFDFIVGVERWVLRVSAYAFLLITDKYPPFSLEA